MISAQLPFAIWNLKGYLDTIPKDLEEAAAVDGASQNQIFRKVVLPLAIPAIAVTGFLGFLGGWTEYLTVAMFISDVGLDAVAGPQQPGRAVRPDDQLVAVRGVRDPLRAPDLDRLLRLPALPGRWASRSAASRAEALALRRAVRSPQASHARRTRPCCGSG